jgi:hypothetical protein
VMLGFGPSSNVSAIERGVFVRRSVGPNNCEPGYTAPHAAAPAAATGTQPSAMASVFMRDDPRSGDARGTNQEPHP